VNPRRFVISSIPTRRRHNPHDSQSTRLTLSISRQSCRCAAMNLARACARGDIAGGTVVERARKPATIASPLPRSSRTPCRACRGIAHGQASVVVSRRRCRIEFRHDRNPETGCENSRSGVGGAAAYHAAARIDLAGRFRRAAPRRSSGRSLRQLGGLEPVSCAAVIR